MEPAQKEYLIQNLPKILPLLECSTTLLASLSSKGLLTKEELDVLDAKRKQSAIAQTAKLFDILYTKTGAFNAMVEALTMAGATGALNIIQGFSNPSETEKKKAKVSRFSLPPKYLEDYLLGNQNLENTFIIYSDDPALTCERVSETVPNSCLMSPETFLLNISCPNHVICQKDVRISIVNCENDVLNLFQEASRVNQKFILVAHKESERPKHVGCWTNEEILWNELTAICRRDIFKKVQKLTNISQSGECWETCENLEHAALVQLIKGNSLIIFNETIPSSLKYYIPRQLISRCKISNAIFDSAGPDVFLIEGIEPHQLSSLVSPKPTETSSSILTNASCFQTKFIVHQSPAHVKEIVKLASALPVHHLSWKNNELNWKFSHGSISYIQQHINENQLYQTEENFLEYVSSEFCSSRYVCISDTPGMGKSKLLEKLAAFLQAQTSKELVSFVVISELVQEIKSTQHAQPQLRNNFALATLNAVSNLVCSNELGKQKIKHDKSHLKHLVLDAFDELNAEDINLGYKCLQTLPIAFPETMFWITTRPHLLMQVEERLHTLGYNIKPFDKKDQTSFLTRFWNQEENLNLKRLTEFANKCLDTVTSKLDCDEDFAGIPLQCLLIGEVYQSEAELYGKSETRNIASVPVFRISSLVDLYEELVRQKFDKFFRVHESLGVDLVKLEQTHMYRSLSLLFPSFAKTLERLNHKLEDLTMCSAGIMEPKASKYKPEPQFIHRTFAEYFVAKLIHQMIIRKDGQAIKLLYKCVLKTISTTFKIRNIRVTARTFKYNVICYFLDAIFTTGSDENSFLLSGNKTGSKKHSDIYLACVYTNFQNIFSNICYHRVGALVNQNKQYLEQCAVVATARSTLKIARAVYERYKNEALNLTTVKIKNYNLLDISVICGKFSIMQYLTATEFLFEGLSYHKFKGLLKNCLEETMNDSENVFFERMQILKYLRDKKPILLHNIIFENDEGNPIFVKNIHAKLALKILLSTSSHVVTKFLHKNVKSYKCADYHYILKCLAINDSFNLSDVICHVQDDLPLWCKMLKHIKLNVAFLDFLKSSGVSVNSLSWKNFTAFELCLRYTQSASVYDWILGVSGSYPSNEQLFESVLKFKNFSCLAHLIQSQRLRFPTKAEWENLVLKVCSRINGVAIGSGATRASKYIIRILEVAVSNGANLNVVSFYEKKTPLQMVTCAKPFLFEVSKFLIDNSGNRWLEKYPDYYLLEQIKNIGDRHESVVEVSKYILNQQRDKFYAHFHPHLTYMAQNFKWAVVEKIYDWHYEYSVHHCLNMPSSSHGTNVSYIYYLVRRRAAGFIKSSGAPQKLELEILPEEIYSEILQDCIKHPNWNLQCQLELIISVCRRGLREGGKFKFVYKPSCADSMESESNQQPIPIFFDNVLTWVCKEGPDKVDKQVILEILKLLIDCGANVNEEDEGGNTPLFHISNYKPLNEPSQFLVKAGGRLFHPTDNEKHPIINLIRWQPGSYCKIQSEILRTRTAEIIPYLGTLLCNVIWSCELECVKELCDWYAKNVRTPLNCVTIYVDGMELTCLHAALLTGNAEILEYIYVTQECKNILNGSAKPSIFTVYDRSYYENMKKNKEKLLNLLKRIFQFEGMLNAENDPDLKSDYYIRDKIAEYWIELGGRVDAADEEGNTLLHYILSRDDEKLLGTVSKLVKSGASVNAQNSSLETPLHKLSRSRYYIYRAEILKLFLDYYADFTICDLNGNSVLHNYAINLMDRDDFHCVAEWFLKNGFADLFTLRNKYGRTPLQIYKERDGTLKEETKTLLQRYGITAGYKLS